MRQSKLKFMPMHAKEKCLKRLVSSHTEHNYYCVSTGEGGFGETLSSGSSHDTGASCLGYSVVESVMFTQKSIYNNKRFILMFLVCCTIYVFFSATNFLQIKKRIFSFVGVTTLTCTFDGERDTVLNRIKQITACNNNFARYRFQKKGDYWVLYNYVVSSKRFKCEESVTYVTQSDYTFLNNLSSLLERWRGPVSIALHAPGTDFNSTLESIAYLRTCTPLVRKYVTFHVYFNGTHMPNEIPSQDTVLKMAYNCLLEAPYLNINRSEMYTTKNNLLYPINIGRNIARSMAETHFVLTSDIELYPSPNLIPQFLKAVAGCEEVIHRYKPAVFALHVFEIKHGLEIPDNKQELKKMLRNGTAVPFHRDLCSVCHAVPNFEQWRMADETQGIQIFNVGKRTGKYYHWEPFYIGTHSEPMYDERLSWEGMSDKIVQAYTMCLLDYSFLILDNAFLVHRPGVKHSDPEQKKWREEFVNSTNKLISSVILPEIHTEYGKKSVCEL